MMSFKLVKNSLINKKIILNKLQKKQDHTTNTIETKDAMKFLDFTLTWGTVL